MEKQVRNLFGTVPEEPEEYILASQISQAEAKKYFIERMRVRRPEKTGIIWWNLLDGWPQMSDAVVDYYFVKKLAYDYIKRCQAPFSVCADEFEDGMVRIYACNDTLEEKKGNLIIKDGITGECIKDVEFIAQKNTSSLICSVDIDKTKQTILTFHWEEGENKGFNHYLVADIPVSLDMYKKFLQSIS